MRPKWPLWVNTSLSALPALPVVPRYRTLGDVSGRHQESAPQSLAAFYPRRWKKSAMIAAKTRPYFLCRAMTAHLADQKAPSKKSENNGISVDQREYPARSPEINSTLLQILAFYFRENQPSEESRVRIPSHQRPARREIGSLTSPLLARGGLIKCGADVRFRGVKETSRFDRATSAF
jgi:hypothetical protein